MKLTILKPRLATVGTIDRVKVVVPSESWRAGKSSRERGYTWQWEKARAVFLRQRPLCAECERSGFVTPANVVDHIVPHRGNQALFWDEMNWQSLCRPCHDYKTMMEGRGDEK